MYDLHCHILPGLDDGAQTRDDTLRMAEIAANQGTKEIVCTPHCSSDDPLLPLRLETIVRRTEEMNRMLSYEGIPLALHPGMELLCCGGLWDIFAQGEFLTLAGSGYLLMEFPFSTDLDEIERAAEEAAQAGLKPVLAHPERYRSVQLEPSRVREWVKSGWVIQLNRGSITGGFGGEARRCALWLMSYALPHLIASDAHSPEERTPDLRTGYDWVAKNCAESYAQLLFSDNPLRILHDEPVRRYTR